MNRDEYERVMYGDGLRDTVKGLLATQHTVDNTKVATRQVLRAANRKAAKQSSQNHNSTA